MSDIGWSWYITHQEDAAYTVEELKEMAGMKD